MNEFLQFAGHYWWLVFPLFGMTMGAIGTVNKQRELSARRRHREQLELMRVQSGVAASVPSPVVQAPAVGDDLARAQARHDDITHRWLDYELDVSKLISYPAMSDGRQPLTAAFLRAKKVADNLRPAAGEKPTPERLAEYRDAVTDYEVAFEVAERDARRVKAAAFTPEERKRLETAQQLLGVAVDQAATPNERQVAYRRVRQELDGLIWLSDEAVENLEKKVALELPRPASPTPPEPAV
ncbi:hypothetical protein [Microbacterium sp. 1P10AE]|uniref:hypothetical protein n=1 Tax=Microbacterium sp. 1P10AE TaxID=3132286 RepID=UPI00399F010A